MQKWRHERKVDFAVSCLWRNESKSSIFHQSQSSTFHQKTQSGLRNASRAAKENLPKENLKATTSRKLQVKLWPVKKVSLKTSEILDHTFSLLDCEICQYVDHTTPLRTQTGKPQETVGQSLKCYSSRILGYLYKGFFSHFYLRPPVFRKKLPIPVAVHNSRR